MCQMNIEYMIKGDIASGVGQMAKFTTWSFREHNKNSSENDIG